MIIECFFGERLNIDERNNQYAKEKIAGDNHFIS
jgi:hypothetical protein